MAEPNQPNGNIGANKSLAAGAAGAAMIIVAYIVNEVFKVQLPAEVIAAGQTLVTLAAVYFTPHGG